jgi:ketosteroid isomerase-like protein
VSGALARAAIAENFPSQEIDRSRLVLGRRSRRLARRRRSPNSWRAPVMDIFREGAKPMKKYISPVVVLVVLVICGLSISATKGNVTDPPQQAIADQIIAREKASFDAWQRKDKAFFADFLSDDATYFSFMNPYLEIDPKVNFLPKFEKFADMFKFNEFQMYNPRVQVYGDVAILTYNSSVSASFAGQPLNYTSKMTSVYVKQGNTWRVVHGHESMNPAQR